MKLNIGIIGAGGFAHFAAKAFIETEGINIVAVTDINETAAKEMAGWFNALVYSEYTEFLSDASIDLVYIATPPFLHYRQSKLALLAGKHVICEKPAALRADEAEELATLAASLQLMYTVNMVQRYNPLYVIVKEMADEKILGNFLHGFFENYASDEKLNAGHWFWDEEKSGGIFIEHGVHFFDLFSGWLGKGTVISALKLQRACGEGNIIDRVQATVLYKEGVVNFYHGFDQPEILDRQEMRLLFERGEITLYGWVPVCIKIHGLMQEKELQRLHTLMIDCSIEHHEKPAAGIQQVRGRFTELFFDEHITIVYGSISEKHNRYRQMLTAMISDQWSWIKDRRHIRVIDSSNAVESVRMAEEANLKAQKL